MHMLTVAYQYIEFVKHIILTFGIEYCIIGASAASPVLARSMPTLFVCMSSTNLYVCHRPTGRIAHAQKHAKHML